MPPPMQTRSALKSSSAKPGVLSNALNSVFTAVMYATRVRRKSFTSAGRSRGSVIKTLCAPTSTKHSTFAVSE